MAISDLPESWYRSYVADSELRFFEVVRQTNFHIPMVVVRMLLIQNNLTWQVYVAGHLVPSQSLLLKDFPPIVSRNSLPELINIISNASICTGNYEERFVNLAHDSKWRNGCIFR